MSDEAESQGEKVVDLLTGELAQMSKVERLKVGSEGLFWVAGKQRHSFRSEVDELARGERENLSNEAKEISKHFGIYRQQERVEGRKTGAQILMVRLKVPAGGEFTPEQWNAICTASDRFADGTLRLTTRQGVQFHHIAPKNLGALVRFLNEEYPSSGYRMSTLGACGDVNRNTMCSTVDDLLPGPPMGARALAFEIADRLAPRSSAYYQVFLTDESGKIDEPLESEEPIYGKHYLPRKFKVGIAHPQDNSIDVLTQDVGLIPLASDGRAERYDLYAGGGLGMTHGQPDTKALLGLYLGRIPRAQVVDAVEAIAILQKEHGDRGDRRQARLKYTIRRMGIDAFRSALRARFGIALEDAAPQPIAPVRFFHGWHEQAGGKLFLGIPVESGRVSDAGGVRLRSAVSRIAGELRCGIRITGNQDLVLAGIEPAARARVDALLAEHGVAPASGLSLFRRQAFGCPALPTCGLAMTHAEHAIPGLVEAAEAAGVADVDAVVRMAGCPNHCSRPPSAEIGITGYGKNAHMIWVGASRSGDRLGKVLYAKLGSEQLAPVIVGLLRAIKTRAAGRTAGDFLWETPEEQLRAWVGVAE
jgi:sulfite reductase beta subunit-like hemoprotein